MEKSAAGENGEGENRKRKGKEKKEMRAEIEVKEVERGEKGVHLMLFNVVCPACGSESLFMYKCTRTLRCEMCGQRYEGLEDIRRWEIAIKEGGRCPEEVAKWGKTVAGKIEVTYEQTEK